MKRTTWICDNCGKHKRGRPENWIRLSAGAADVTDGVGFMWKPNANAHACSIECAHALIASPDFLERTFREVEA